MLYRNPQGNIAEMMMSHVFYISKSDQMAPSFRHHIKQATGGSGISAYQDISAAENGERSNVTCLLLVTHAERF